jgi:phosphoribosyl-ATP pyrophosphohydrolase/phosphoribosyl-AMP cyclohydrolase
MINMENMKFDAKGLIPAVIQQVETGTVLMLAYMNKESLAKTVETGVTWFYSRSRNTLWQKGETSGHVQKVQDIYYDCDADTLLIKVEQTGVACHEGTLSCFSRKLGETDSQGEKQVDTSKVYGQSVSGVLHELYHVINDRKRNPQEGSYTTYLFEKGQDKILKKVGEEAAETIIASKNNDKQELISEMSDLWYHCLVLLANHDVSPSELLAELQKRRK